MEMKILRHHGERASDGAKLVGRDGGLAAAVALRRGGESRPAAIEPVGTVGTVRFRLLEFCVEFRIEIAQHCLQVGFVDHAFGSQPRSVQCKRRRMIFDGAVHQRLRERRLVGLVVAETPVAEHVDHDVLAKQLAEFGGDARAMHHCFRIVAVHMENRRLHHQRDIGRVR